MKKLSSIVLIAAGIMTTTVSVLPLTSPATAQVASPRTDTTTPATGTQGTGTTTYERNDDKSGLWGLVGLAGLLGFLGRRKEDDTTVRRGDTPVYRDPNVR
jgi:MYXO-CTERM domain-containing protein